MLRYANHIWKDLHYLWGKNRPMENRWPETPLPHIVIFRRAFFEPLNFYQVIERLFERTFLLCEYYRTEYILFIFQKLEIDLPRSLGAMVARWFSAPMLFTKGCGFDPHGLRFLFLLLYFLLI